MQRLEGLPSQGHGTPTSDELRHVEETRALGIATERQAQQLVEEALGRVLTEGVPEMLKTEAEWMMPEERKEAEEWPEEARVTPATGIEEEVGVLAFLFIE